MLPYKIDSFPRINADELEVWVIGGLLRNEAYQGFYHTEKRGTQSIDFIKRDRDEQGRSSLAIKEVSIGESGVWGIDRDNNARFYDKTNQRWLKVPDAASNLKWHSIESGSQNNVFAIELQSNNLFFRADVTKENPRGEKWVSTGLKALQVSASPYITYIVSPDGKLNSFTMSPTQENIKTLVTSLKIHDVDIVNKLSIGFDNTFLYLDDVNNLMKRDLLPLEDEQFDSKWRWQKDVNLKLTDVSSGPLVFGIMKDKIVVKKDGMYFMLVSGKFPHPLVESLSPW